MNELHLLDILAARHGCFISDLNLSPILRRAALLDLCRMDENSYPLSQWQDTVRYLTGDERDFASVKEIKVFIKQDDFPEIVELFGQRVAEQAQKTHIELNKPRIQGIDDRPITAEGCIPISYEDDLHGKIVVIKPEVLRREYRRATRQLKLCMGGFGASPHSRGSACYCVDLYTGKESRYERMDVLGTIQPEDLPGWAKHGLTAIQQEQAKKKTAKERER